MTQKSLLGFSILFHAALGLLVARIEMRKARAATAIEVSETKKREVAKKIEEQRQPPEPPKKALKRAAPVEKPAEAPPPQAAPLEALPDFGLELSGAVGGVPVAPTGAGAGLNAAPVQARAAAPDEVGRGLGFSAAFGEQARQRGRLLDEVRFERALHHSVDLARSRDGQKNRGLAPGKSSRCESSDCAERTIPRS